MNVNITLNYTEQALAEAVRHSPEHFSWSLGAPFPQPGDLVENQTRSGERRFVVVERVFRLQPDSMNVQLLLDLAS